MEPTSLQQLLIPSNAGMRVIAITRLLNQGDLGRLRQYIDDNYAPEALEMIGAKFRLIEFKSIQRLAGRLRIDRALAIDKHRALLVLESEKGSFYLIQMVVSEDYPHKILVCSFTEGVEAEP